LTTAGAVAAVGITYAAGMLVHVVLLAAVLLVVGPQLIAGWLSLVAHNGEHWWPAVVAVGLCVCVGGALLARRQDALAHGRRAWSNARGLSNRPVGVLMLLGGSTAVTLLHGVTLLAVLRGIGVGGPTLPLIGAYLVASCLAALLPVPGGLGSFDFCLGLSLASAGVHAIALAGAVLCYRMLTSWLPVIPSAATFAYLVRRGALSPR
jgi:uncharacterized membrane protein YbhN (UPF0104 family)